MTLERNHQRKNRKVQLERRTRRQAFIVNRAMGPVDTPEGTTVDSDDALHGDDDTLPDLFDMDMEEPKSFHTRYRKNKVTQKTLTPLQYCYNLS